MSRSRAFANQERQAQNERLNRMGRTLLLALATLLTFTTISLLAADRLFRPDTFVIDQLKIKGKLRHLDPIEIERLVAKRDIGNFFSIELDRIKNDVEALAWVQNAEVRREWPDTLSIRISEHRPVMRWNESKWVNSVGQVVDLPGEINVGEPIELHGRNQDSALILRTAYLWKKRLASSGLELKALTLSGSHAWSMTLVHAESKAKFDLLLGREEVEPRLQRFQNLFEKRFRYSDQLLQRVDARYPDGLAIKSTLKKTNESDLVREGALAARN